MLCSTPTMITNLLVHQKLLTHETKKVEGMAYVKVLLVKSPTELL